MPSSAQRIVVGPWARVRKDPAVDGLRGGPAQNGVFARFEGPRRGAYHLVALDSAAAPAATSARTPGWWRRFGVGDGPVTWIVTGSREPAVRAAADQLDERSLRDRYAVAALPSGRAVRCRSAMRRRRMRSPLAYVPRRTPLGDAGPIAAGVYLGSFALVAFLYSSPIVLAGAGAGSPSQDSPPGPGARFGPRRAGAWRWASANRGQRPRRSARRHDRFHGLWLPLLGSTDVSAEAFAEGGVLALRIVVVLMAFSVHSACVDPTACFACSARWLATRR